MVQDGGFFFEKTKSNVQTAVAVAILSIVQVTSSELPASISSG